MVKCACKVASSECLSRSFTAVHKDIPKCMPEEPLHPEPIKLSFRGFESRRASQNVSPVVWICPSGRKNGTRKRAQKIFYSKLRYHSAKREKSAFSSEQCESEPCLKTDTVLSKSVPKDFFPHRAGSAQIFSRCFCMNDSETTLLPLRRITYYEKDDYQ